jgi:hypothetical protein
LNGFFRLTLDYGRRAYWARAWGRSRAFSRSRAFNNGATRAWAWRAFTHITLTLTVINDYRLRFRNATL